MQNNLTYSKFYKENTRITIWVSNPIHDKIKAHSKQEERPDAYIVRKALKYYFEKYEHITIEAAKSEEEI